MSLYDKQCIRNEIERRGPLSPIAWLLWIGIVRPHHSDPGRLRWPFSWGPWHVWVYTWRGGESRCGVFRNRPGVVRDIGTWLPRRWGFYILGFEFGQRG